MMPQMPPAPPRPSMAAHEGESDEVRRQAIPLTVMRTMPTPAAEKRGAKIVLSLYRKLCSAYSSLPKLAVVD